MGERKTKEIIGNGKIIDESSITSQTHYKLFRLKKYFF